MQSWEYKTLVQRDNYPIQDGILTDLGRQGWEMTAVVPSRVGMIYYFKRPGVAGVSRGRWIARDPLRVAWEPLEEAKE